MFPLKNLIDALLNIVKIARDPTILDLKNTLKSTRTSPTKELDGYTLDAGSTYEITKSGLDTYSALIVVVNASYDPNASSGVRVRWLYSADGSNFDSPEDAEAEGNYSDLTFSAGSTRQKTILIPIFTDYIKIQIINLDSSYPVTLNVWTLLMR